MTWWYAAYLRVLFVSLGAMVGWFVAAAFCLPFYLFLVGLDSRGWGVADVILLPVAGAIMLFGAWRGLRVANRYARFRA